MDCFVASLLAMTTQTGDAIPITPLQAEIFQAATGLAGGAMAMLAVGYICSEIAKNTGD
jgi:hypothetical protein